jgi:hypothetical protein
VAFHGDDLGGQVGEERSLEPVARSDLEDPVIRPDGGGLDHQGDEARLARRLGPREADGTVGVGDRARRLGDEVLAPHCPEGGDHSVRDGSASDEASEALLR